MDNLSITTTETDRGYEFSVSLEGKVYEISCTEEYYQKLTHGSVAAKELVRASFAFLLEREPIEAIMGKFELPVISRYFPEYEKTMVDMFHAE